MDSMNVFYVPVVKQAAHHFGGILINLLVQRLFSKPIDLLQIHAILKQLKDFKIYRTLLVFTDAME